MTTIRCENDRGKYTINIEGHSEYNPGNDIVCASCSILTYTLLNALANMDTEEFDTKEYDGGFVISVKGTRETWQEVKTVIETIMLGYELLQEQYPANVSVEW
ncbi:MAG TPA: ribosomal-processing cysteine protease Prp [Anaerovoracaceae bacterium]|nr:ribosomal-processing cysteine protease Prp [Anaerovoracaceae bacterium]